MKAFNIQTKLFSCLKTYDKKTFMSDLMAGIIVGIVALPLAIAFGIASGVTPEKGIITAIVAGLVISLFGGSKVQIGGPTGAFIIIIYGIIQKYGFEGLTIATLMAGFFLVLFGLLRLGTIIKYIPYPIVVGFTSGIAVTIFTTQIKDLFGLTLPSNPSDFIEKWGVYLQNFNTIDPWCALIGVASVVVIAVTPRFSKKIPGSLIAIILMTIVALLLKNFAGVLSIETIGDRPKVRIIRMRKVPFVDSTGIHNLTNLCEMSKKEGIQIVLSGVREKVNGQLEHAGFYHLIGEENICSHINLALKRANEIIVK